MYGIFLQINSFLEFLFYTLFILTKLHISNTMNMIFLRIMDDKRYDLCFPVGVYAIA